MALDNGYDLDALDTAAGSEAGTQVDLRHPATGAPIGMWVRILGPDSATAIGFAQQNQRRRREQFAQERRSPAARTAEELDDDDLEWLVAVSRDWYLVLGGEAIAFSQVRAREIYRRFRWIRNQLEGVAVERGNFLPTSSAAVSSPSPSTSFA